MTRTERLKRIAAAKAQVETSEAIFRDTVNEFVKRPCYEKRVTMNCFADSYQGAVIAYGMAEKIEVDEPEPFFGIAADRESGKAWLWVDQGMNDCGDESEAKSEAAEVWAEAFWALKLDGEYSDPEFWNSPSIPEWNGRWALVTEESNELSGCHLLEYFDTLPEAQARLREYNGIAPVDVLPEVERIKAAYGEGDQKRIAWWLEYGEEKEISEYRP